MRCSFDEMKNNGDEIADVELLKIVEVRGSQSPVCDQPMLHIQDPRCPHLHKTACDMRVYNRTGIPLRKWAHSFSEYAWCQECEERLVRMSKNRSHGVKMTEIPWLARKVEELNRRKVAG